MAHTDNFEPLLLGTDKMAEIIDKTHWAKGFEWQDLVSLAEQMKSFKIKAGDTIFEEFSSEKYMAIIGKGSVEVIKSSSTSEDSIIATLNQGQSLGEMCLIDGQPRSAKATAKTDTILLLLDKPSLEDLKVKKPDIAVKIVWKLAEMLSQRLRKTSGLLIDFLGH